MTKSNRNIGYDSDEDITDVEFISAEDDDTAEDEKFTEFKRRMHEASKTATINILRVLTNGKEPHEAIDEIPIDRYEWPELIRWLRDEWGGGQFRMQLRDGGKITKWATVVVAMPIKAPATVSNPDNSNLVQGLLARMDKLQEQLMSKGNASEMEMLEKMKLYKELFAPSGTTESKSDPFEMINKLAKVLDTFGIEIGQREQAKGLEAFAPAIAKLVDVGLSQPHENPSVRPSMQGTQQTAQQNQPPKPNLQEMAFKLELQKLAKAASKNSDPGIYAQVIVDQYPIENIKLLFVNPNFKDKIVAMNPALKMYNEWLDLLSEHIKALIGLPSHVSHEYQNPADDLTTEGEHDKNSPDEAS